uniref:Pancreatic progenitor cell differentiation and proliferation factor n=1 Tax=Pongo abelii TaxID=9601 RepID=A0A8I5U2C9_PONAB
RAAVPRGYKWVRPRVRTPARARVSVVARCPAVSSANGLRGLAPPSPPPVIVRRGPRGVAAQAAWVPLPATAPAAVPSAPGKLFPTPQVSAGPPLSPPAPARSWQHQDPISLLSGLPKADPGHWWASLFFGKSTLPFMATVLESAEHSEPPQASSSMTTCGLARDAPRKPPGGQSSTASAGPPS